MKKIKINYYAFFKDAVGKSDETIDFSGESAAELYEKLTLDYEIDLRVSRVKVAINDEFRPLDTKLNDGDKVVFIPPVAGG